MLAILCDKLQGGWSYRDRNGIFDVTKWNCPSSPVEGNE
jgi:hypothetical protein